MAGERPKFRLVAKSKTTGAYQDVAAMWEGDRGVSGMLDREIESIKLKSGAVLTNEGCYFNLQIRDDEKQEPRQAEPDDNPANSEDVPF